MKHSHAIPASAGRWSGRNLWRLAATALASITLFAAAPNWVGAVGWVTPTGNTDGVGWTDGVNARDGNTSIYASHAPVAGWGDWETFSIGAPIWSDRFRVYTDFGYGEVDQIQVDVSDDGVGWTTAYVGTVVDATWDSKVFTAQNVQYARIRYHRITAVYTFWLYEFNFYETPPTIDPPTVTTTAATSVEETSATAHGVLDDSGGEPCEVRVQYGLTTGYEIGSTTWVPDYVTGNTFGVTLTGLTSGNTYHFRAQARNGTATSDGADATFLCGPAGAVWVSPTGSTDATGSWLDRIRSYDDEASTSSSCYHEINDPDGQWSPYIYLTRPLANADSLRFLAKDDGNIDLAEVGISADGIAWTTPFSAAFVDQTWTVVGFTRQNVGRARVRFHLSTNNVGMYWKLYEFDFHNARVLSVATSNSVFAFDVQPLNTWLPAESAVITNDSLEIEDVDGSISAFSDGGNSWTISPVANGPNQVRAQWSTTSAVGPWTDIAAYDSTFALATNLAPSGQITLYLRIQTPTSSASYAQYSSTLSIIAK